MSRGSYAKTSEGRKKISERMKRDNPMRKPEHRKALSRSLKGNVPWNKGVRGYMTTRRGMKHSQESKKKMSEHHWSKRYRDKFIERVVRGSLLKVGKHPNGFEKRCGIKLEEMFPDRFRYVGNGSVMINGHSPDFIDEKNKVVILCNGWYWHLVKFGYERNELYRRIVEWVESEPFREAGYEVWFIWEDLNELRSYLGGSISA